VRATRATTWIIPVR